MMCPTIIDYNININAIQYQSITNFPVLKRDPVYQSFYTQNFRHMANIKVKYSYYKQEGRKSFQIIDHPCQPPSDHIRRN